MTALGPSFHRQLTSAEPAVSSGDCAGFGAGVPVDLHRFKTVFPDRWAAFLKAHWRNSVDVAHFFDVDEKTARNWMEGVSAPRGALVAWVFDAMPAAAAAYLFHEAA